ncbi:ABC transporter permease [Acetoanaerobium noterae]|uniref:ABC transporter permease n=1 Tax=Acetoanaerobium noterae TaxID=745369 RepID=UPI003241EF27
MNAKSFINKLIYLGLIYLGITFVVYPIGNILRISLISSDGNLSLSQYIAFFSTPVMITALKNTITVGILTVITCMLVGVFMAFYTQYYKTRFAKLINIILLTPFVLPGVIIVIAFIQLYSEMGIINQALKLLLNLEKPPIKFFGINGIIFVHTFTQYIYFYIHTKIALRFLDYSAVESARSLGASKFQVFKDIIFPHLKPAILTSAFMTFATGVSSFSAPYLIGSGYRMMSTQILQSKMNNQMQMASVQVVLLMGISVITMLLYNFYSKQNIVAKNTRNITMKKVVIKNKSLSLAMNLCAYLIILFIITPIVGIVVLSFADSSSWMMKIFPDEFTLENYKRIFLQKRILSPVKNSIQMSLIAAGGASLIAIISSYLFIKDKGFLSKVLNFLIIIPMAIPASTLGVNLITAFNKKHILLFNNPLVGTYSILPIAYVIATITLVSRSTYTAFTNYNPEYDFASRNLGASNTQTFRWIFIPIVSSGIISGFSLAFMRSLGEYTISALLYGVHNKPLSIAMVNALHDFDIGISMAYGGLIILLGTVFLVLFSKTYE